MSESSTARFTPPTKDPWKSFRGILSGLLILEMIVVLLALPVIQWVSPGNLAWKMGYVLLLAGLLFVGCIVVKRPWALNSFCGLQLLVIGGWWIHPGIGMVGVVFAFVWAYVYFIARDVQKRMDNGKLPGQEPVAG